MATSLRDKIKALPIERQEAIRLRSEKLIADEYTLRIREKQQESEKRESMERQYSYL